MEYKFIYLTLHCLALVALVVSADEEELDYKLSDGISNSMEKISYSDYNSIMWFHRMLTERERWDHWQVPKDVDESDADFVRGLTAYAVNIFKSELMHHWSYGTETGLNKPAKEEFIYRFNQKIVVPCAETVRHLAAATAAIYQKVEREGRQIHLAPLPEVWYANSRACQKLISAPTHWLDLAYRLAEANNLL